MELLIFVTVSPKDIIETFATYRETKKNEDKDVRSTNMK
jgi:hypothetical protein